MRRLKLRESYTDVLIDMLVRPANGTTTDAVEIAATVPVIEKLRATEKEDHVLLEEVEWELIRDRVMDPNAGFLQNSPPALQMITDVVEAETVDLSKLEVVE